MYSKLAVHSDSGAASRESKSKSKMSNVAGTSLNLTPIVLGGESSIWDQHYLNSFGFLMHVC